MVGSGWGLGSLVAFLLGFYPLVWGYPLWFLLVQVLLGEVCGKPYNGNLLCMVWWSVLWIGFPCLSNYFTFQEILGMLFLFSYVWWFPAFILLFKLGVPPFHFWAILLVESLFGPVLGWFLVYHKFTYLPVLVLFLLDTGSLLFLGLIVVYAQLFLVGSFRTLLVLISLESFTWLLLLSEFSNFSFLYLSVVYLLVLLGSSGSFHSSGYVGLSLILLFMNYPLVFGFFVKYLSVVLLSSVLGISVFLPLLLVFISIFSSTCLLFLVVLVFEVYSITVVSFYSFLSYLAYLLVLC